MCHYVGALRPVQELIPTRIRRPRVRADQLRAVIELDRDDAGLLPTLLVAVTVKEYVLPAVRPVILAVVAVPAIVTAPILWVPE